MDMKEVYKRDSNELEFRGMRGLAAAIIRQAFEDADSNYAPLIEVYRYSVKPKLYSIRKFAKIENNKLFETIYKYVDEKKDGKIKRVKRAFKIELGSKSSKYLYLRDKEGKETRILIQDIPNGKQKLLLRGKTPVGYLDKSNCFYCEFDFDENGEIIYNVEKRLKKKSSTSTLLSRAEVYEARNFILAQTKYWKTALEFWCDVADLDWNYIVAVAKRQKWYPEYSKGLN